MKNNNYKILVLSDLKDTTIEAIKNTVNLAKIIGGDIHLFHIKKPTDIVERESQLSALRTINEKYNNTKKQIEHFVNYTHKAHDISINYSYAFGNIKNEIEDYILKNKPDIIVLGKRKSKQVNVAGDNITDYVLKVHKGITMISGNQNVIEPHQDLSLGVLNVSETLSNVDFAEELLKHTKKPLKSFKFISNADRLQEKEPISNIKTVEYLFECNDNSIQNLNNYISKNNINMLFIDGNYIKTKPKKGLKQSDIKSIMNKLNISLLISN